MDVDEIIGGHTDDSMVFTRQRRNVMVSCLIVITIVVLNLHYGDIKVLDVKAGSPENFDIAWAVLLVYFVWRLFQAEAPRRLLFKPSDRFMKFAQTAVKKSSLIEEYKKRALSDTNQTLTESKPIIVITEYGKAPSSEPLKTVGVSFEAVQNFARTTEGVGFDLCYTVHFNNNSSTSKNYHHVLQKSGWITIASWAKGYLLASWRDQYFSEYLLPFWLGFACIFYCIIHHIANH